MWEERRRTGNNCTNEMNLPTSDGAKCVEENRARYCDSKFGGRFLSSGFDFLVVWCWAN